MKVNPEALWIAITAGIAVFGLLAAPGLVWLIWLETDPEPDKEV